MARCCVDPESSGLKADEANDVMQASVPERLLSALGAMTTVALLGYLLFVGMTVEPDIHVDQPVALLAFQVSRPERHPHKPHIVPSRRSLSRGKKLPRSTEGKAPQLVILPTQMLTPMPLPVLFASTDGSGPVSSGASGQSGRGEGAAGRGNGADGGDYDSEAPPRLIKGRLKFSDLPRDLRDRGIGGSVSVRYDVEVDGQVVDCVVLTSSGTGELDQQTCELIQQRFRFAPAHDRDGHPIRSTIEEAHWWEIERGRDPPRLP